MTVISGRLNIWYWYEIIKRTLLVRFSLSLLPYLHIIFMVPYFLESWIYFHKHPHITVQLEKQKDALWILESWGMPW